MNPALTSVEATPPQGSLRLLALPAAQRLLSAPLPARMAYISKEGSPRIVPSWFHWNGTALVMVTYLAGSAAGIRHPATRLAALRADPRVAVSIDTDEFPPTVLTLRGSVTIDEVDGVAAEYAAAARRYLGPEDGGQLLATADQPGTRQARITLRPSWVGLLDFDTRLPSAQGGVTAAATTADTASS